jgi:hypothetical protein
MATRGGEPRSGAALVLAASSLQRVPRPGASEPSGIGVVPVDVGNRLNVAPVGVRNPEPYPARVRLLPGGVCEAWAIRRPGRVMSVPDHHLKPRPVRTNYPDAIVGVEGKARPIRRPGEAVDVVVHRVLLPTPASPVDEHTHVAAVGVHNADAVAPVAHAVEVRDLPAIGRERRIERRRGEEFLLGGIPPTPAGAEQARTSTVYVSELNAGSES